MVLRIIYGFGVDRSTGMVFNHGMTPTKETLIARRSRFGFPVDEAAAQLDELIAHFDPGENLASALVYWDFATVLQAGRFCGCVR